jgi:putative sigma-54 modulation protein
MEIAYTFRNVESSEGVKQYAKEKLARLQKYVRSPLAADVVLSQERHLQRVEISTRSDAGRHSGAHESEDMYASIDLVVDKLDRQLRDYSDRHATDRKKHSGGVTQMSGKRDNGASAAPAKNNRFGSNER